ncbi:unnamed protein product [Effrenium voratum]|nr:unnamed protein product [Effrenium voratum]
MAVKKKKKPQQALERQTLRADFSEGLSALLGEACSVEDFRRDFFEQKALHVARQSPGYYAQLADLSTPERLFKLLEDGMPVYRINMFRCVDGNNKETPDPPPANPADVRRLFKEGWSIQWLQPQQEHDALAGLVNVLESEFGCLVGVNAYITPAGSQGLAPHFDDVEVFVLQLGGSKAWSLHGSTTSSPLPSEQQTLPRYSSGDLEPASLAEPLLRPKLAPGDLLYFPRGTIHHAPNEDDAPSVHLTISGFQRQALYDLVHKTFEEAMSELWGGGLCAAEGAALAALAIGRPQKQLSSAVAQQLRRLADAVEAEAGGDAGEGPVAAALGEMSAEFVRARMPPQAVEEECSLVTPSSVVHVDASALSLLPLTNDVDEAAARLIHNATNQRRNHMMTHPRDAPEAPGGEGKEEEEEEEEEEEAEEEDLEVDPEDPGQVLSGPAALALRLVCASKPAKLEELLKEAELPQNAWEELCQVLTQLTALGLARVEESGSAVPAKRRRTQK